MMMNFKLAFFVFAFVVPIVHGSTLTVGPSSTYPSISQALAVAVDNDILQLESGFYNGTLNRNFDFTPFANLTIIGQGSSSTTVDCELQSRFFYMTSSLAERNIMLSGLRFSRCKVIVGTLYGGAIYIKNNFTSLTLNDVVFERCSASQGGAIYIEGYYTNTQNTSLGHLANVRMSNVSFLNNEATIGGAAWLVKSDVVWSFGTVSDNSATADGGALWLEDYTVLLIDNVIFQNNSGDHGGAGRVDDLSTFNGTNVQFLDNKSVLEGGALWTFRGYVYCKNCYGARNYSPNGGTFYFTGGGYASFSSSIFEFGRALLKGGFAFSYNSADMEFIDCTIRNFSTTQGGAFMVNQASSLSLTRTTVANNSATGQGEGGAVYLIYKSKLTLTDSTIEDNSAVIQGAGVWCGDSSIQLDGNSEFISNDSPTGSDIHCSTLISGTSCDVEGGKYDGLCKTEPPKEGFKTGYVILIAVVGGLVLIMVLIGVMVAYFRRDRKNKLKTGKLWENMEENKNDKEDNDEKKDEKSNSEDKESKRDSKRESKRDSKRDSKRESKKSDDSSRASLQESEASEKKSGSGSASDSD